MSYERLEDRVYLLYIFVRSCMCVNVAVLMLWFVCGSVLIWHSKHSDVSSFICLHFLSHCWDRITDEGDLTEGGWLLWLRVRGDAWPWRWGSGHSGHSAVMLCPQSVFSSPPPFCVVWIPAGGRLAAFRLCYQRTQHLSQQLVNFPG